MPQRGDKFGIALPPGLQRFLFLHQGSNGLCRFPQVLLYVALQGHHAAIQRPYGAISYFRIRQVDGRQLFAGQCSHRLHSCPFLLHKGSQAYLGALSQRLGLPGGQRVTAAQHFFPIGCQVGKGLVTLTILRLPDHHLTLQVLLGFFQFLDVPLQVGGIQLCFYMDILCVDLLPLPLLFLDRQAVLFQLLVFPVQSLLFGFGLPGCQVAVGTVGNVLIGLDLVAEPLVFSMLFGNLFQQLPALLQPVGFLFHLGIALDGLLHGMDVHRLLMYRNIVVKALNRARLLPC